MGKILKLKKILELILKFIKYLTQQKGYKN